MIIVGLDRMIKVFSFTRPPSQIKVLETGQNPNGLISLSPTYQNVKLVYPSRTPGNVTIVDLAKLEAEPRELQVHQVQFWPDKKKQEISQFFRTS